jgi:putative ABC transport system permease protein
MLRTREIGVRMVLGAQPGDVTRSVSSGGLGFALAGAAIGAAGAFGLTRLMDSTIFGVGASDPLTFASVTVALLAVAAFASYIPSRQAAHLDPAISLRIE